MSDLLTLIENNLLTVILIPLIAALIGWITNYIAVKMIFRPRRPRNLLGFKIHGLIPRRQKDIARKIGETVQKDLISHEDVIKILNDKEVEEEIALILDNQADQFISGFLEKNPMLAMFLQGDLLTQIKSVLLEQMQSSVPAFLDTLMLKVENKLDFKQIVEDKVNSFDLSKLEEIIYRISSKELKTIEILGGVLGFFVGLSQVAIMLLTM